MEEKTRAIYLADLDYFQSQLEKSPQSTLYLPVAAICARLEKYEEALSVSTRGLEVNPGHTQIQVLLAESMIHVGRKDEAREILYDILMADEDNYKALKLLGQIFKSDGDRENAVKYMRAAYLKSPEDDELIIALEEMGESVGRAAQGSTGDVPEGGTADDEEDDGYNFNVDANISNVEVAISDILRDMSGHKGPGDISDNTMGAAVHGAGSGMAVGYPEANASLQGQELTDDEILKALSNVQLPGAKGETHEAFAPSWEPASPQGGIADILSNLPQDSDILLPAPEPGAPEVPKLPETMPASPELMPDLPAPEQGFPLLMFEQPVPLDDGGQYDIEKALEESLLDLTAVLGGPPVTLTAESMEYSVEMPEDNDTQLPEELVNVLQDVAPQQSEASAPDEVVELPHDDDFFNLTDDEDEEAAFVPAPFIPTDFAHDVLRESGLDAAGTDDEPITPESVKQEKESEKE